MILKNLIIQKKQILIQFHRLKINCSLGDSLTVLNSEKNEIIFNYCNPIRNQLSNSLLVQSSNVFLKISSKVKNDISLFFAYFLIETTAPAKTSTPYFQCKII